MDQALYNSLPAVRRRVLAVMQSSKKKLPREIVKAGNLMKASIYGHLAKLVSEGILKNKNHSYTIKPGKELTEDQLHQSLAEVVPSQGQDVVPEIAVARNLVSRLSDILTTLESKVVSSAERQALDALRNSGIKIRRT